MVKKPEPIECNDLNAEKDAYLSLIRTQKSLVKKSLPKVENSETTKKKAGDVLEGKLVL